MDSRQPHEWLPEATAQLVSMWSEGKSATLIAQALGTTRNAVLGKRKRMGLAAREVTESGHRGPTPYVGQPRAPKVVRVAKPKAPRVMKFKPVAFVPRVVDLPEPSKEFRCDFAAMTECQCRFAYGDGPFEFCGHQKKIGSSYCEYHTRICWRAA